MKARHLTLHRRDTSRAIFWLALAAGDFGVLIAAAVFMSTNGGPGPNPYHAIAFAWGAILAGICANLGIGYAVRASFGLDLPEEDEADR